MENLKETLMQVLACRNVTLLLSDDFNLSDIDCETIALKENATNLRDSKLLLEAVSELGLKRLFIFQQREMIY